MPPDALAPGRVVALAGPAHAPDAVALWGSPGADDGPVWTAPPRAGALVLAVDGTEIGGSAAVLVALGARAGWVTRRRIVRGRPGAG